MIRYRDWAPTSFDPKGLNANEDYGPRPDWFVMPTGRTRDSGPLEESNFASALKRLGGESETVEVCRFGHWISGWFEIILVDPKREDEVQAIQDELEDYPILDEDDLSEREHEEAREEWDNWGRDEYRKEILKKFEDVLTEDEVEAIENKEFDMLEYESGGDGPDFRIDYHVRDLSIEDVYTGIFGLSAVEIHDRTMVEWRA